MVNFVMLAKFIVLNACYIMYNGISNARYNTEQQSEPDISD